MEHIQEISIGLSIVIVILGGLGWLYTNYQQPDLTNGQYFESAWIDIKDSQITLYVEFVPDGKGRAFSAVNEAICRVKAKSWINEAIDGRPIVVIMMVRENTILVPITSVVVYEGYSCDNTLNKSEALKRATRNMTFLKENGTITVVDQSTGEHTHVNMSEFESPDWLKSYTCVPVIDMTGRLK